MGIDSVCCSGGIKRLSDFEADRGQNLGSHYKCEAPPVVTIGTFALYQLVFA